MNKTFISALMLLLLQFVGCGFAPSQSHQMRGHSAPIDKELLSRLQVDKTTRAEVLLSFGVPTESFENDRFFIYQWDYLYGHFFFVGAGTGQGTVGGGGVGFPVRTGHYLGMEFTPDNLIKRIKHIEMGETFSSNYEQGGTYNYLKNWLKSVDNSVNHGGTQ